MVTVDLGIIKFPLLGLIELSPRKTSLTFLVFIPLFIALTYLFSDQIFFFFQEHFMSGQLALLTIGITQVILYFIMLAVYAPYRTTVPLGVKNYETALQMFKSLRKDPKLAQLNDAVAQKAALNIDKMAPLVKAALGFLPPPFNTIANGFFSGFSQNNYYKNVVIEYWLVKKILFIAIPLFIILTTSSFADQRIKMPLGLLIDIPIYEKSISENYQKEIFYQLLSALWAGLFFTVSGGLLRMLFWLGRKDFRYNFARGCAIISKGHKDKHFKLEYMMLSLNSYDKFLQRTLRVKINELIYLKIMNVVLNNSDKINAIDSHFDSIDRLFPATELSKDSDLQLADNEFFVKGKVQATELLKEWGVVSAAVIPLIVTIIKATFFPAQ